MLKLKNHTDVSSDCLIPVCSFHNPTNTQEAVYLQSVCESSESFCVMVFLFVWQSLPQNAVAVHFRRRRVLVLDLKICSRALLSKDVSKLWLSLKLCNFPTFPGRKQQGICLVSSVALVSNVYSGPIQTEYIAVYFIYHRFFSSDFKQVCHSIVVQMTPD